MSQRTLCVMHDLYQTGNIFNGAAYNKPFVKKFEGYSICDDGFDTAHMHPFTDL